MKETKNTKGVKGKKKDTKSNKKEGSNKIVKQTWTPVKQKNIEKPVFIGRNIVLSSEKELYRELSNNIYGIGKNGALEIIKLITEGCEDPRSINHFKLSESQKKKLEELLESEVILTNIKNANNKNRIRPKDMEEIMEIKEPNAILINNKLRTQRSLDNKNHIKINCRIGIRKRDAKSWRKIKIHGQRSKSTGRTKQQKGFQKVAKNKKLER